MRHRIAALVLSGLATATQAQSLDHESARTRYLLSCGGCHGLNGASDPELVPVLKDQVGYFLNLPQGRDYLVQLPNVAFSRNTDEELTGLINYVIFDLGGDSVPRGTKPYTVQEVSELRHKPLTEVSLLQLRQQLVTALIDRYHATSALTRYGADSYKEIHPPQTQ